MTLTLRRWLVIAALTAMGGRVSVRAELLSIKGEAQASVAQIAGNVPNCSAPIQTDFNDQNVPLTQLQPPATSRARLDHFSSDGSITAGGRALTIFNAPGTGIGASTNDAGLDLGAFSEDSETSWCIDGSVREVRSLQLSQHEIDPSRSPAATREISSHLNLSGVLLITASDSGRDLSGTSVSLSFSVTFRQNGRDTTTPLEGSVELVGTPEGDARVENASDALAGTLLTIVDFAGTIEGLPVVKALPFVGASFPYSYEINVGQPFELELNVQAHVSTTPGGVGAAAVFGTPPEGLGAVLSKVKGGESGAQLSDTILQHVDTTGQAYVDASGGAAAAPAFPACGAVNPGLVSLLAAGATCGFMRGRNKRRIARIGRDDTAPASGRCHTVARGG